MRPDINPRTTSHSATRTRHGLGGSCRMMGNKSSIVYGSSLSPFIYVPMDAKIKTILNWAVVIVLIIWLCRVTGIWAVLASARV